jgi:hypothetical protein
MTQAWQHEGREAASLAPHQGGEGPRVRGVRG